MQHKAFPVSRLTALRLPSIAGSAPLDWRALSISLMVQAGLLSLFISSITIAAPRGTIGNSGISVFDLAHASQPPSPPHPPKDATEVPPPVVRVEVDSIKAASRAAPSASPLQTSAGEVCDVAGIVGKAVQGNPDTLATLAAIDATDSPVSRAVMMWDGAWVGADPLAPVHASLASAIAQASPACLAEPLTGPNFIFLDSQTGGKTIVLVVGSGSWRWQDVLDDHNSLMPSLDTFWPSLLTSERSLFPSTGQDVDAPS
jgi:hypothetical protein